ncbi:GPO family capsid scaffolding protein [Chromobacterium sp. IIBBL 290-4]|uniref:GPO family capsid scaffolding protein n=1 Tax=Chromobacterium sp. IIBBL 290-4 TaxID=2953890 RepID=UPI0020B84328|nr:GPO family capsid scaffolding protein [Chromobacterium sp. IIBBL 290-4]UTH73358.1 GPO family capsid scaffolding protein [Chromobacterium sp. IIBBL 290-4]
MASQDNPKPTGKKSKFFRIATEGDTTDGREISRQDIEQMARNYNPERYGARVNIEHVRGIMPDGPFGMYGDIIALKTQENAEGKLQLMAQIDPTPGLVDLVNVKRQKVYTSIEVQPNFAKSGEAYLVGLAATDSPASLGTEMLRFCAGAQINPLAHRKQSPDNLFTAAIECNLEFEDDNASPLAGFSDKIKGLLGKFSSRQNADTAELSAAVQTIAESQGELLEQFSGKANAADVAKLREQYSQLKTDHDALVTKLSSEPITPPRSTATGAAAEHVTDC